MVRFLRRRSRLVQKGVNAIFSGKTAFGSAECLPDELDGRGTGQSLRSDSSAIVSGRKTNGQGVSFSRILVSMLLIVIGLTMIGSGFFSDLKSLQDPGGVGPDPRSPTRDVSRISPSFVALTNVPETVVDSGGYYHGTVPTSAGDFLVVQIAYSEGSFGILPNLLNVTDGFSGGYNMGGSAAPGVGSNFWEQVWVGRASQSSNSTNVMISPDWKNCIAQCVSSIIISMTVARYREVGGIGGSLSLAPNSSSTSQVANVGVGKSGSLLVELLSHGAYNNCQSDAATPGNGQTLRNCFTGTTERTELFDHTISQPRNYNESYSWSQIEVQRGIYLELDGT